MKRTVLSTITLLAYHLVAAPILLSADRPKSVDDIVPPGTEPQVLGEGYGFCEGPAADAEGNVYFSDGKKDSIHVYRPDRGVELFVSDSTDANGMMFDAKGRLLVCEGAAFRVVAFDVTTKKKQILASQIDGTRFNEPNDITIDRTGGFYFTDPNYRHRGQETVMKEDVYYVDAEGRVRRVSTICVKPNGILLTPDDQTLYLADNGTGTIYKYRVAAPGVLTEETKWVDLGGPRPDGMTLDESGNLYIACGGAGIKVYSADGAPLGTIRVPYASNCVFGGPNFTTLYVTSRDKFLGIPTRVKGVPPLCAEK
ncbi:SMP-30/gluconolactonase/LRE family protein [Thermopirellula anaerolimosa]